MRLGDFVDRLEKVASVHKGKELPRAVRSQGLDRNVLRDERRPRFGVQPEARRNAVLEHVEDNFAGRDPLRFVVVVRLAMPVPVAMAVSMTMLAAALRSQTLAILTASASTAIGIRTSSELQSGDASHVVTVSSASLIFRWPGEGTVKAN
jgi:hypothetical protein